MTYNIVATSCNLMSMAYSLFSVLLKESLIPSRTSSQCQLCFDHALTGLKGCMGNNGPKPQKAKVEKNERFCSPSLAALTSSGRNSTRHPMEELGGGGLNRMLCQLVDWIFCESNEEELHIYFIFQ